ncbi:unnamed protein product, partial [marine sediment metagenome]
QAVVVCDPPISKVEVFETVKDGWTQTFPSFDKYVINFVPGQPVEGVNFGNYQQDPGSIHGLKFNDRNGNGRRDAGEEGLASWAIGLRGQTVAGASIDRGAVTDGDGRYSFLAVPAGLYLVVEVSQTGWLQTFPRTGFHTAVVEPGSTVNGMDFGNGRAPSNEIHGIKYYDRNGNGRRDEGEEPLESWEVFLGSSQGVSVTKTDSDGSYQFNNLPPDTYYLNEEQRDGWRQTAGCLESSQALGQPPQCRFQWGDFLSFSSISAQVDFGNWEPGPGSIHGLKWR